MSLVVQSNTLSRGNDGSAPSLRSTMDIEKLLSLSKIVGNIQFQEICTHRMPVEGQFFVRTLHFISFSAAV